jgi:hypothetical protein
MKIDIDGKLIQLKQQQVIGAGGEGTVFRVRWQRQDVAVKLYHEPTAQRQQKLLELLAGNWQLPQDRIAIPYQIARDPATGEPLGPVMPFLDAPIAEIDRLANKKQRAAERLSTRQVARIFLDGATVLEQIHQSGLVVGDLNDQNILYRGEQMLWIDVDAWQFANYACPVACEDYLAPELYNLDLSVRPCFTPEHDWYAFAVHLFRSLLLVHPYGGLHPNVPQLTRRAAQRLFVLQQPVSYPKFASTPALLSEELLEIFERYFAYGWRGAFPRATLEAYIDALIECPSCQMDYPRQLALCPHCQTRTLVLMQQSSQSGVRVSELIRADGPIVFWAVRGNSIYALAYEQGHAVLYRKRSGITARRTLLFKALPGANYAMLGETLIVNPPASTQLFCLDINGDQPRALCQSASAIFSGSRQAQFRATTSHLYTILNHALIASALDSDALQSRVVRPAMEQHTWFEAANVDGVSTMFGYFQVYHQQLFWLQYGTSSYEVHLTALRTQEVLLDIAVYFSASDLLVRRLIQEQGVDYLLTDIVDYRGNILHTLPRIKRADHPCANLHGLAYAQGTLLHATDEGIVQERVVQGSFKTFTATRDYIHAGDVLEIYRSGLLVVTDRQVFSLEM